MYFYPHGPYEVPRNRGLVDRTAINVFWENVDRDEAYLSTAIGIYIFSIRAGKGITPWYVGKTESSFQRECFQHHKITIYNECLNDRSGTPLLTLVAKMSNNDDFFVSRGGRQRDIQYLEKMIISKCLGRNQKLSNKRNTSILADLVVYGFNYTPQGAPSSRVQSFRKIIGN